MKRILTAAATALAMTAFFSPAQACSYNDHNCLGPWLTSELDPEVSQNVRFRTRGGFVSAHAWKRSLYLGSVRDVVQGGVRWQGKWAGQFEFDDVRRTGDVTLDIQLGGGENIRFRATDVFPLGRNGRDGTRHVVGTMPLRIMDNHGHTFPAYYGNSDAGDFAIEGAFYGQPKRVDEVQAGSWDSTVTHTVGSQTIRGCVAPCRNRWHRETHTWYKVPVGVFDPITDASGNDEQYYFDERRRSIDNYNAWLRDICPSCSPLPPPIDPSAKIERQVWVNPGTDGVNSEQLVRPGNDNGPDFTMGTFKSNQHRFRGGFVAEPE